MTWSYTAGATPKDNVRMLITDTDSTVPIFQNEEITAFLTLNGGNVWFASATALLIIAASETLIQKKLKLLDLSTDGPAEAEALRKLAAELMAVGTTMGETFDIAPQIFNQFGFMEFITKDALRNG